MERNKKESGDMISLMLMDAEAGVKLNFLIMSIAVILNYERKRHCFFRLSVTFNLRYFLQHVA
jgi:hypothetical protein